MGYQLERRPYGEDSTEEQIAALRERVSLLEPGILLWREIPMHTQFTIKTFEDELNRGSREHGARLLLIDIAEASVPNAEIREALRHLVRRLLSGPFDRLAVATGRNFFLTVSARFVLGAAIDQTRCPLYSTNEEALADLRNALRA